MIKYSYLLPFVITFITGAQIAIAAPQHAPAAPRALVSHLLDGEEALHRKASAFKGNVQTAHDEAKEQETKRAVTQQIHREFNAYQRTEQSKRDADEFLEKLSKEWKQR